MYQFDDYKSIAQEMIDADADRDKKFKAVDDAHNVKYELPQAWQNIAWIRPYPTTKPADLIDAAVRALSTKIPQLSVTPLLPNEPTKEQFDLIERGLMWTWKQIERRSQTAPTKSIVESAIKYGEVCAQVVYLPYQKKMLDAIGSNAAGKRAESFGPFSLIVHHPGNVHVQYSDLMAERVVLCKRQQAYKIADFWGKNAEKFRKAIEGNSKLALTDWYDVYDYWDSENRCVWVAPVTSGSEMILLDPQAHGLGFLPWSCRVGGSAMDEDPADKRRPLLNSLINGDILSTVNMFRSLMISLAMARAAEPTKVSVTPTGEGIDIDATEPLSQYKARQGESITPIPAGEIGQSIQGIYAMLGGEMDTSTGMSILMQNNPAAGMAFATFNAVIQAGMGAVWPHKQVAERAIADIFTIMVSYLKHSGDPLISYDDRKQNISPLGVPTLGTQEMITADMLPDVADFYAEVKLTEKIPSDEMGTMNAAVMGVNQLKLPVSRGMAMLDITDPKTAIEEWAEEQKQFAAVQMEIQQMQFEQQMMQQKQMMQMQQEMGQMQAQQAQEQGAGGPPPGMPGSQMPSQPGNPALETGFANASGQSFNGAMGGSSPLAAAPELTGVGLPQLEGRDNRGLRVPPEGRQAVQ